MKETDSSGGGGGGGAPDSVNMSRRSHKDGEAHMILFLFDEIHVIAPLCCPSLPARARIC